MSVKPLNFLLKAIGVAILVVLFSSVLTPRHSQRLPIVAGSSASLATALFIENFEQEDVSSSWVREMCCDHSLTLQQTRVRDGETAARFELRREDPDIHASRRTELAAPTVPAQSERWYGFSLFLPDEWQDDGSFEILAQWHSVPDFDLEEEWRSPPLNLTTREGRWRINNRWDPKPRTEGNDPAPEGGRETLWEAPYETGVWTDWVVHARWSHLVDGTLQIWKDGELVVDKVGPNTYHDQTGPYFKIGIYKPDWKYRPQDSSVDQRVLYVDEVRVGDESTGYAVVVPSPPSS